MLEDDGPIDLRYCTLPGTIRVTQAALGYAMDFQALVPGKIPAFFWYQDQRMRASKDAPWVEMGPGLGLQGYSVGEIPEVAICREGSFRYAVLLEEEVVASHPLRTIDLDDRDKPILR